MASLCSHKAQVIFDSIGIRFELNILQQYLQHTNVKYNFIIIRIILVLYVHKAFGWVVISFGHFHH